MKKFGSIIIMLLLLCSLTVFTAGCSLIKDDTKSTERDKSEKDDKNDEDENDTDEDDEFVSEGNTVIDIVEMDPIDEMELDEAFILKKISVSDSSATDEMDGKDVGWIYNYFSKASVDEAKVYFENLLNDMKENGEIPYYEDSAVNEDDSWYMYAFETDDAQYRIGIMTKPAVLALMSDMGEDSVKDSIKFSFDFESMITVSKELMIEY